MRREEVRDLDLPTTLCHLDQRMHPVDFSRTKLYKVSTFRRSVFVYFSALHGRSVHRLTWWGTLPGLDHKRCRAEKSRGLQKQRSCTAKGRAGGSVFFSIFPRVSSTQATPFTSWTAPTRSWLLEPTSQQPISRISLPPATTNRSTGVGVNFGGTERKKMRTKGQLEFANRHLFHRTFLSLLSHFA